MAFKNLAGKYCFGYKVYMVMFLRVCILSFFSSKLAMITLHNIMVDGVKTSLNSPRHNHLGDWA